MLLLHEKQMHHPALETLTAFGLGHLSEVDSKVIELHLADCAACCRKLEDVPDDSLVYMLQASAVDLCAVLSAPPHRAKLVVTGAGNADFIIPKELDGHPRYQVLERLGTGGMGTVYKVQHRLMERVVALKIVNPLLVNKPGAAERFTREVKAAAQLVHANIVTAYDAEKVRDLHFLVMEFVEGRTLAQILAVESELPVTLACEYLRQTALGLQHALDHGIVHRDVKPQNLMVTSKGEVKILDFGLTRFVSELVPSVASTEAGMLTVSPDSMSQERTQDALGAGSTEVGILLGSPDYMAPEQAQDAHAADARADIYSMGCTLYHLLAGQVPFPETSLFAKLEAHREKQPIPLEQMRPGVPSALAKVVAKMMAKDPAQRYQTPAGVAEALRPFTSGEERGARDEKLLPSLAPRRSPLASRPLLLTLAMALGALTIATVFFLGTSNGTIRIEVNDDSIEAVLTRNGTVIKGADKGHDTTVAAGEYYLKIKRGDLEFETDKFILKKRGQVTLKIELLPDTIQVVQGDKVIGEKVLDPDRRVAKYVLSIGGKLRVNEQDHEITAATDLPHESFQLRTVALGRNQHVSDAGLAHFKDCKNLKNLTKLTLNDTQVSDAGLAYFKDCKNLNFLYLENMQVGDAGLAHFKDCKNLGVLALSHTQVTDAGLAHFKDCKNLYWLWLSDTKVSDAGLAHFKDRNLIYLHLDGTQVSDAGLAYFKDCKNLKGLLLNNTQVGDAGLAHFKDCKNLNNLLLKKTKVTAAGFDELKKALPRCNIEWDGDVIEPSRRFGATQNRTGP